MDIFKAIEILWPWLGAILVSVCGVFIKILTNGIKQRDEADANRDKNIKYLSDKIADLAICTPAEYKSTVAQITNNTNNIIMITKSLEFLEKRTSEDYNKIFSTIDKFREELKNDIDSQFKNIITILGRGTHGRN